MGGLFGRGGTKTQSNTSFLLDEIAGPGFLAGGTSEREDKDVSEPLLLRDALPLSWLGPFCSIEAEDSAS